MSSVVNVAVHKSQAPENVTRDLIASLRRRKVNHKFHYDSVKQTNQWLALHQAYSPSRNDADGASTYDRAFAEAAGQIKAQRVQVVGLGCGGGQKDTRLLKLLQARGKTVSYTPSDVSVAMTLVAQQTARAVLPTEQIFPLVCDLATADDLAKVLAAQHSSTAARLLTFFGMIPNFEPMDILPKLAQLVRPQDTLLFSANLAPGTDYATGVAKILPQYDNELTREWLLTFLLDLGVTRNDGVLRFKAERGAGGLRRIVARFRFRKTRRLVVAGRQVGFLAGENVRLFFSYRYTPELVRQYLAQHGLAVCNQWVTQSGEEGVFLCRRDRLTPRAPRSRRGKPSRPLREVGQ
jgi:L-histidine N-alpha-methyltransferase